MELTGYGTQVGGLRMYARRPRTPGRPGAASIVLVHGLGVSSRYMLPTLRLLARDWNPIAPDLPGFGLSDKPARALSVRELADALAEWLTENSLPRPVLLGNSLGCQVISSLASRRHDLLQAAVLVSPTMDPASSGPTRDFVRLLLDGPRERLSEIPLALGDYRRAGNHRIWRTFTDAVRDPVTAQLRTMTVPTLVVRGSRDPIVSATWAQRVQELLPDGKLVVIQDAPHAVNYSAAEALVTAVESFLGDLGIR